MRPNCDMNVGYYNIIDLCHVDGGVLRGFNTHCCNKNERFEFKWDSLEEREREKRREKQSREILI